MQGTAQEFGTLEQAAVRAACSVRTLYRLRREGRIDFYRREGDRRTWVRFDEVAEALTPIPIHRPILAGQL